MRRQRTGQVGEIFAEAMNAYGHGRMGVARRLSKTLAEEFPAFGGTHYLLGLLALDRGHARRAADHLARAIAITPGEPAPHLAMADALERCKDFHSAMLHYRTVLAKDPSHAEAHARLGDLLRRTGRRDEAIVHCRRAVEANPAHAEALNALGSLLLEAGQPEEAARHLKAALNLRADWPSALNNFGLALHRLGRRDEAVAVLAGAVDLRPGRAGYRANLAAALRAAGRAAAARAEAEQAVHADSGCAEAWLELGLARQAEGHAEGAAAAFDRAVALAPDSAQAHWCLAEACRAAGSRDRAARHYRRSLEIDPEDRHGALLGLGLVGGEVPDKAPAAYVRQLFDDYAETFDVTLVERLDYRAPALLADALVRSLGPLANLDVADLGCGTGLAAPVLRRFARRLDGIDLSPAMVAKARDRGLYDDLAEGDIVQVLAGRSARYDLVVAADVLVYLGDLVPVMEASFAALRPGGAFAFTVERADDDTASYRLGAKSRYAHSRAYVAQAAEQAGFTVPLLEDAVTRRDAGADVPGMVAVVRRG
jgi:predicted TPR repeat methyltransferase